MVRIAFDVMGGDLGYKEMVKAAAMAADDELELILVGDEALIREELSHYPAQGNLKIRHAGEIIGMEEEPALAYKAKRDASITVATALVRDKEADVVISAGSTGAQMTAGIFVLGRIKGIRRPAIATYYPTEKGVKILLDAGATPDCEPLNLHQFAQMAVVFGEAYLGMENPSVGLLNNGGEEKKGSQLYKEAHQLLKGDPALNFKGNVEGRDVPRGKVDIVVCDGFVGNVVLKIMEGLSGTLFSEIKARLTSKLVYKLGALLAKGAFQDLKAGLDYSEYGGAPLLGLKGISMISHGSSDAKTMYSAIRAARKAVESGFNERLIRHFEDKGLE